MLYGGGSSLFHAGWGFYSSLATIKDLPEDASWFAKMMVDPPVYAPLLLFLASIAFLIWVFWDRGGETPSDGDATAVTHGDGSPAISGNTFHGDVYFHGKPSELKPGATKIRKASILDADVLGAFERALDAPKDDDAKR